MDKLKLIRALQREGGPNLEQPPRGLMSLGTASRGSKFIRVPHVVIKSTQILMF